jgi:hypothetical protein
MGEYVQEQSEQLLDRLTQLIEGRGLTLPALLLLQATRPLSFIASQGLLLCEPVLSFFYESPRIAEYADLLADRANIDRLVARLEADRREYGKRGEERG